MTYTWRLVLSFFSALISLFLFIEILPPSKLLPEHNANLEALIIYLIPILAGANIPWIGWSKSSHNKSLKPLIPLIGKGDISQIELQISKGAKVNSRERHGVAGGGMNYPLLVAAKEGSKEIVELLLNAGAKINIKGSFEETSLHLAAKAGHIKVVELLIARGAELNMKDSYTFTALDYAENITNHQKLKICKELKENKLKTANILRENKARRSKELFALSKLIESGSINDVNNYLGNELNSHDVNEANDAGSTPCHFAAQRGDKKILELLILNGADLNIRNKYSHTPLDMSLNDICTNFLRKHGAKTGEELKAEAK